MQIVQTNSKAQNLPDLDRLSIVLATILLAYALARFVNLPAQEWGIQLPGIFFSAQLSLRTLVTVLVSGMTAAGSDWVLRSHPAYKKKVAFEHWLLPALTAWVISIPIFQLPLGTLWWVGFILGGTILMFVLIAEYIAIDPRDVRHQLASVGLTVIAYAIYLILAVSLRYTSPRLYVILPALTIASVLVCLRHLHLRLSGQWAFLQAGIVALVVAQFIAGLHYLPLTPIAYGLLLTGLCYCLTDLLGSLMEGSTIRQAIIEPLVILLIFWGAALWVG